MSLILETYVSSQWIKIGELKPGDRPGSISNNSADGSRDIYIFECQDDNSKSTIYKSKCGLDTEVEALRIANTQGLELIKELSISAPDYEMQVKTDRSPSSRPFRFTHV